MIHSGAVSHHEIDNKSTSVRGEAVDPSELSEGGYRWFRDEQQLLLHYAFSLATTPFYPQIKISRIQIKKSQNQIKISQNQIKISQNQIKKSQNQIKKSQNQI